MMIEINHKVSKEASNLFWMTANEMFHSVYVAKGDGGRKVPQFSHLREQMYLNKVPPINMEIGYQSKEDGEIVVAEYVNTTPVSQYPRCSYRRLYEIASVDVSIK